VIKAFIIDPRLRKISKVSYPMITFREINAAIGSRSMDMGYRLPSGDLLWVDDEGMLKATGEHGDATFTLGGSPLLFGRGFLTGPECPDEGDIRPVIVTNLESVVLWRGYKRLMGFDSTESTINHPVFGPTKSITRIPVLKDLP
jgi:hypothetical protein